MSVKILDAQNLTSHVEENVNMGSLELYNEGFSSANFRKLAHEFCFELSTTGICGLANLNIDPMLCLRLESDAKVFFELSASEKEKISMEKAGKAWRGYFKTGDEYTAGKRDLKEGLYFGTEHSNLHPLVLSGEPLHGANQWPAHSSLLQMRSHVLEYMGSCERICRRLMLAICVGFEMGEDAFADVLREPTTLFRIFNYPPKKIYEHIDSEWGVAEHTDMGFLTLLQQGGDVTSLEVRNRAGEWIWVPPAAGVFYVNIGDMLEYWSRGRLWATPHRVRESVKVPRLSFPYFYDPAWNSRLVRLDEKFVRQISRDPRNDAKNAHLVASSEATPAAQFDRWDKLNLHALEHITYGEFVWEKVKNVFPWLSENG